MVSGCCLVDSLKIVHAIFPDPSQDTLCINDISTMSIIMMSAFMVSKYVIPENYKCANLLKNIPVFAKRFHFTYKSFTIIQKKLLLEECISTGANSSSFKQVKYTHESSKVLLDLPK